MHPCLCLSLHHLKLAMVVHMGSPPRLFPKLSQLQVRINLQAFPSCHRLHITMQLLPTLNHLQLSPQNNRLCIFPISKRHPHKWHLHLPSQRFANVHLLPCISSDLPTSSLIQLLLHLHLQLNSLILLNTNQQPSARPSL